MTREWYMMACLLLCLLGAACREKKTKPQDTLFSGAIKVAVDETLSPLVQEEIDVFEALYPLADIIPYYTNEVEAMNLLLQDSVRFVVATRPLTADELDSFHSRKFFPRSLKIAVDGIALIVHKENPDSILNVNALQEIFSGKKVHWKELNPASKGDTIRVVYDHSNSSTVRYVLDSICRGEPLSPRSYGAGTNREVVEYVARARDALGVIGVNWISEEQDSLSREFRSEIQVVRVSRSANPDYHNSYQPYQYYLNSGDYPFTRDVYINLNDPRSGLPSGLTNFITSARGQRIVLRAGLLPATMPVNVVHINNE